MPTYQWYAKPTGGYLRDSVEAINNAWMIYNTLAVQGWSLNAVCGILGNIRYESYYNPWRWQSDIISTPSTTGLQGYGLFQFTPSGKYILDTRAQVLIGYAPNYLGHTGAASDGRAQCMFVDLYADDPNVGYYATSSYPLSYQQYRVSLYTPEYLAEAWLYNFERPQSPNPAQRAAEARYWYDLLSSGPTPPPPPTQLTNYMKAVLGTVRKGRRKEEDDIAKRKRTLSF